MDGRPRRFTDAEVAAAELEHAQKAGAQVERVRAGAAEVFAVVRASLNATAGGQASARVMLLAHHAQLAHQALVLQSLVAEKAFADEKGRQSDALRNTAGLACVATDALNKAYEAAREEGKAANPVADLRKTIGLQVTDDPVDTTDQVKAGSAMTHGETVAGRGGLMSNFVDGIDDSSVVASPSNPPGEGGSGPPSPGIAPPSTTVVVGVAHGASSAADGEWTRVDGDADAFFGVKRDQ